MIPASILSNMTQSELIDLVTSLASDKSYGVLTSNAGAFLLDHINKDASYDLVAFDLAGLHSVNSAIGYDGSNAVFGDTIRQCRSDDMLVSLKFSGDEFYALLPVGTGKGYCERIQQGWDAAYTNLTLEQVDQLQNPASNDPRVYPIHRFTASFAVVEDVNGASVNLDMITETMKQLDPIKATGKRGFVLDVRSGESYDL